MTVRRHVRSQLWYSTPEVPLSLIKKQMRAALKDAKHTVIETTWWEESYEDDPYFRPTPMKVVSVRYVTGGQRLGLPASVDWKWVPDIVEFPARVGLSGSAYSFHMDSPSGNATA